jgi:hypothetical protein
MDGSTSRKVAAAKDGLGKKAYSTPKLLEYGSVAKLTQGITGAFADAGAGMMMVCL